MYFSSKLEIDEMVLLKTLKAALSLIPNRSPVCLQIIWHTSYYDLQNNFAYAVNVHIILFLVIIGKLTYYHKTTITNTIHVNIFKINLKATSVNIARNKFIQPLDPY